MAGNKITRDDLVEDKVFQFGPDYAKTIQAAIEANAQFVASFEPIKKGILEIVSTEEQFKKATNNKEFIAAKQAQTKSINEVTEAVKVQQQLQKNVERTTAREVLANGKLNKELIQKRFNTQQINKDVKQQVVLSSKLASEYQKQEVRLTKLRNAYKELATRQALKNDLSRKEIVEMNRLAKEANKVDTALKKVDKAVGQSQRNVGNYTSALGGLTRGFRSLIGAFGIFTGIYLFANAIRDAFGRIKDFDKSMQNLAGVMRSTRSEINDLEKTIISIAGASVRTSNEVAKLAESLATLGKSKDEIKDLLKPIIDLSLGLDAPADEAGEFLVMMLNAFGKGSESAAEFADTIATIRTSTTLDFQKMRDAFSYIAPISRLLGKDLAYTGAVVGILADNSIKAQQAGRLMSTALIKLANDGKTLDSALKEVNDAVKEGKTEYELLAIAGNLFGAQAAKIGVILAQNSDDIEKNSQAIRDNGGALEDLVNQQLESVDARLDLLTSSYEQFVLSIENGNGVISKSFISLLKYATAFFDGLSEWNKTDIERNVELTNNALKIQAERYKELGKEADDYAKIDAKLSKQRIENLKVELDQAKAYQAAANQASFLRKLFIDDQYLADKAVQELNISIATQEGVLTAANTQLKIYTDLITGAGFEDSSDSFGGKNETIKELQKRISGLNTEVLSLNTSDIEGVRIKQQEIKVLQDKLNAILGVTKGTKAAAKEQKDYTFEINKFINETKLKALDDFAKDEKKDFDLRQVALKAAADLEISLIDYVLENKLKKIKEGSEEERLILIQAEAEKQAIRKKFEGGSDDLVLAKMKADAETKAAIQKKLLNEELTRENENFNNTLSNYKTLEAATEAHEQRVAEIKKKYAIDALNAQITAIESLLSTEQFSADERIRLEAKIAEAKKSISDLNTETYKKEGNERVMTEEEITKEIIRLSQDIANEIGEIFANLSQRRIDQYEKEIEKSDERYDKLLENEDLLDQDRKRLEETKERARKELERKIVQEKRKQAILDKAIAIAQIGINTAVNVSESLNPFLAALAIALGAAQIAVVASTPIPQYELGTDDHKGGFALVGEKRPEVIQEPNKDPYVVSKPTVIDLPKGTKVTPSLDEYEKLMRSSILASVESSNKKMNSFQTQQVFDGYNTELLEEMKMTRKAISHIKQNVIFKGTKAPDINYQLWRMNQINWRN